MTDQPSVFIRNNILLLYYSDSWTSIKLLKGNIEVCRWNGTRDGSVLVTILPLGIVCVYHERPV